MSRVRLEDLPLHTQAQVLAQLKLHPAQPKKKSSRRKSVLVKAPIFCTRCGSYEHKANDPKIASLARPIDEVEMSLRLVNGLDKAGIKTIGDLAALTEPEIVALDPARFNDKMMHEIKSLLDQEGLVLGMSASPCVSPLGKVAIFAVNISTSSEQNREMGKHWAVHAAKRSLVRDAVGNAWKAAGIKLRPAGYRVTITRISHPLADALNLQTCLKSVIDEVAARMKVDDDSPLVEWKLDRELGKPGLPAVRIELEELT